MKTILYLLPALLTLGLYSCEKDDTLPETSRQMQFSMIYPTQTKATDTGFEAADTIGVYVTEYNGATPAPLQISGNHTNNAAVIFDGTVWTPREPIYWSETAVDVYAYYPYLKPRSVDECRFSVATDQNTLAADGILSGYEASDFLWAKNTNAATQTSPVALQFKHRMSKINVTLKKGPNYEGALPDDAIVRIHSTIPTALIDLALGMPAANPHGSAHTINCKKSATDRFTAIIVPQRIPSIRPFVELIMGGVSYMVESTFTFKPGIEYSFTLIANTQPGKILIEIGGQIDNTWE